MAIAATQQILNNGPRNITLKYTFDGTSGDATEDTLVDARNLDSKLGQGGLKLMKASWALTGFSANLQWEDGDTNIDLLQMPAETPGGADFTEFGGVVNNAALQTGNIVFTTTGWTNAAAEGGYVVLELKKRDLVAQLTGHDPDVPLGALSLTGDSITVFGFYNPALPGLAAMNLTGNVPTAFGLYDPFLMGAPDALTMTGNAPTVVNA